MICTNNSCKKKFAKPLELYNGMLTCPHCKKEQTAVQNFKITSRNEELFTLSEVHYLRYLSPKSSGSIISSIMTLSPNELLEKAIEYCLQSAKEGNPKAIYRMGYYNEHYMETTRSETDRIRMAFEYYSALCFSEGKDLKIDDDVKTFGAFEFEDIKQKAAKSLLSLYGKYSRALAGASKYDYQANLQRIIKLYGEQDLNFVQGGLGKRSKVKNIYDLICACFGRGRSPLCGIFPMNGKELKTLFKIKKDDGNKYDFIKLIVKGMEIRYVECDENGNIDDNDRYFTRFPNEAKAREILSGIDDNQNLYLYFYSVHGKHAYLSGGQMEKIKKELAQNDYELLCRLIDFSPQEYVFFDDDIVQFAKGKNIKGAAKNLIDFVCGE